MSFLQFLFLFSLLLFTPFESFAQTLGIFGGEGSGGEAEEEVVVSIDCIGLVTAPAGTICQDSVTGLSVKCQNPDSGGSAASYCEPSDTDAWVELVSLANIETQSGNNIVTAGEMQLGVAFPTNRREIYDANSEANAFIVGVDTDADNASDLSVRIFCDPSAGECYFKMDPDGPTNFPLADTYSFNIYDATTPIRNLLFSVPEDGTSPSPAATTTKRGFVELATDGENAADVVVQGNDSRLTTAISAYDRTCNSDVNTAGTVYLKDSNTLACSNGINVSNGNILIATSSGTVRNLYCLSQTSPGVGNTFTFSVVDDGVPTAVTCQMADAATSCDDTVNTAAVAAGSQMVIELVKAGTTIGTGKVLCQWEVGL